MIEMRRLSFLWASIWVMSVSFSPNTLYGQSSGMLTIDDCYRLAKTNYPVEKQFELIDKSKDYSLEKASKGTLPHIRVAGQATYQSDVTKIPISLPNLNIPSLTKDQYKVYGEVSQPLTDLFTVNRQQELIDANAVVEKEKVEVELYKLKEQINQLYFGILMIDAQIAQVDLLKKDIQYGINKTEVAIANGVALKSSADVLKAELLKADQRAIDLEAARNGYVEMLGAFIHRNIDEHTQFIKPASATVIQEINRPEIKMFDMQKKVFDVQDKLNDSRLLPEFSLFLQGGYGKPGLDMLSNGFDLYYIGGIRAQWNITGFYTRKNDQQLLSVSRRILDVQKETFLFNTQLSMKQQNNDIAKFEKLIQTDKEIIGLRERIKASAQSQLSNGTSTVNDYLTYVNAEDQARQNLVLHETQLLMAQYNYKITTGN